MKEPEYLYHYTNINTLALILKNRNIKFSSLKNVDDLEEVKTKDMGDFGKYCFISCWTDEEEESIPFWHMYTNNMQGVRLKLPVNLFKKYRLRSIEKAKNNGTNINNNIKFGEEFESYFTYNDIFSDRYTIFPNWLKILEKVQYTDDENLINVTIFSQEGGCTSIKTNEIGRYKRRNWEFQKEWRYIFVALPISFNQIGNNINIAINEVVRGKELPFDTYFLKIDDIAFENMEITLGPAVTDGDKIIVESLVRQYNPKARIFESKLSKKVISK